MDTDPDELSRIAKGLSIKVAGQHAAISQLAKAISTWRTEPEPRFPLRLLFTGPTSVGKQLLASSVADHCFGGRFARHSWFSSPGPLRLNQDLRQLGSGALVLFFKLFDYGENDIAALEMLLATGGLILGNGRSMSLDGSIIILSASHDLSAELYDASQRSEGSSTRLFDRFPHIAGCLDSVIDLMPLNDDDFIEIAAKEAVVLSDRAGCNISVTDRAALAPDMDRNPRNIYDVLALQVARALNRSEVREVVLSGTRTLIIDHTGKNFHVRYGEAPRVSLTRSAISNGRDFLKSADRQPPFLAPRPADFPALTWRPNWSFDVFISYKIRKHREMVLALRDGLQSLDHRVWLDEDQIGVADDPWYRKTRDQLIDRLVSGVGGSRCTVVFEAELEAVARQAGAHGLSGETEHTMRSDEGALVAWNWQKLEIDSSSRVIVVRPPSPYVTIVVDGEDITSLVFRNVENVRQSLTTTVATAIDYFKKHTDRSIDSAVYQAAISMKQV